MRKKIVLWLPLLLLLCGLLLTAHADGGKLVYWTEVRNIKAAPSDKAEKLQRVPAYTVMELGERKGGYIAVTLDGTSGYVLASGMIAVPETTAVTPFEAYVASDEKLLRIPEAKAAQYVELPQWSTVTVTGEYGDWYYAVSEAGEGFLAKSACCSMEYTVETIEAVTFQIEEDTELHETPLPTSAVTGTLAEGTSWTVTEASSNGWYRVESEGLSGFVPMEKTAIYEQRYWDENKMIRATKREDAKLIGSIPKNTIVNATKVDDHWYRVSYGGVRGYVRAVGVHKVPQWTETEREDLCVRSAAALRLLPVQQGGKVCELEAWTRLKVLGEYSGYWYVRCGEHEGYIAKRLCSEISIKSRQIDATEFYVSEQTALLSEPLHASEQVGLLEPGTVYATEWITGNDWYRVVLSDGAMGYVPKDAVIAFGAKNDSFCAVQIPAGTVYYTQPDAAFASEQTAAADVLLLSDSMSGGYLHLWESGLYVEQDKVRRIGVKTS